MASIPNDLVAMSSAIPNDLQPVKSASAIPNDLMPIKTSKGIPNDLQPVQPQLSQEQKLAGYTQEHPVLGNVARFGIAGLRNISQGFTDLEQPFAPETAAKDRANIGQAFPVQGAAGTVGDVGTSVLQSSLRMASKPVGIVTGALQSGGQALGQIQDLQNQGVEIPWWKRGLLAGGAAATGALTSMLPGSGKALEGTIANKVKQYATQEAINQGVGAAANVAQNTIQSGYDPNASLTQGLGVNAAATALSHGLTHGSDFFRSRVPSDVKPVETTPTEQPPESLLHRMRGDQATKEEGTYQTSLTPERQAQIKAEEEAHVEKLAAQTPPMGQGEVNPEADEPFLKHIMDQGKSPRQYLIDQHTPEDQAKIAAMQDPHATAQENAGKILQQEPKFTEGAFGKEANGEPIKTEPGEFGTREGKAPPMPEPVKVGEGQETPQSPFQASREAKDASLAHEQANPPTSQTQSGTGEVTSYGRQLVREVGSWAGSDIGLTKTGVKNANNLRELWGKQDLARVRMEEQFKPDIALGENLPKEHMDRLVDEFEGNQPISDPKFQAFADKQSKINADTKAQATALGWDVKDWGSYIGRLAEFPDESGKYPGETGYRAPSSLAGREQYLKSRKYDTFTDFRNAVESGGGRLKYDNPVKMALAKNIEVQNSLLAHDTFQNALDQGSVRPLTKDAPLRPGEKLINDPVRWTHSDDGTRFAAHDEVADLMNYQHSEGAGSKLGDLAVATSRVATRVRMVMGLRHYVTEALGASGELYGQAWKDLLRGQFKNASKEVLAGTPGVGTLMTGLRGMRERTAAVGGEETPLSSQAIAKGGGTLGAKKSILDPNDWDKMKSDWAKGDTVNAANGFLNNTVGQASKVLFDSYIPNMRRGVMGILADSEIENAQRRGLSLDSDEFKDTMAKHVQTASNMLGVESEKIHFQNKTAATVSKLMFGLPNWVLGKARFSADAVTGMKPLFEGKNMSPATYSMLGAATTTAVTGAAIYAMLNKGQMPQSWQDMRHVPTPWKDGQGRQIRLTIPYPWEMVADVASGDRSISETLQNRLSPPAQLAEDMLKGQDYKGSPTRDSWTDIAKSIWHTLAEPYGVEAATRQGEPVGVKMLGSIGINPSAQKFSQSPAERMAHDLVQSHTPNVPRTDEQEQNYQLEEGLRNHDPKAMDQAKQMIQSGQLKPKDYQAMVKKSKEPQGLEGLLQRNELRPADITQIWEKANDQEKVVLKRHILQHAAGYPRPFLQEVLGGK